MTTTATTTMPTQAAVSPTPASERIHVRTDGPEDSTSAPSGAAEPFTAQAEAPAASHSANTTMAGAAIATGAATGAAATTTEPQRKRSLLKRRSLRSKAEPTPISEPQPVTAHPEVAPTAVAMPVPETAPASTTAAPTNGDAKHKTSLRKRLSLRSSKHEGQDQPPVVQDHASPTSPTNGVLSRDYTKPGAPSTRSARAPSPPAVAVPHSRPQSRATAALDYSDSNSEGAYSDVDSDEPDAASYASPVSHGGRSRNFARQQHQGHRRSRTVDTATPRPLSTSAGRTSRDASRPRSATGIRRTGTVSSRRTNGTSRTLASIVSDGGAFGHGAGTVGPSAVPEPEESAEFRERANLASKSLSTKQSKKIWKEEVREGKRLSKILKAENKVERKALEVALKELAELQAAQKIAVKNEGRAHTAQSGAQKAAHKAELGLLEAQRVHQLAQTELASKTEALNYARRHALNVTESVARKSHEVDLLRAQKGADVREREAKMTLIQGKARV